ncbi:hypothetical protein MS3_00007384 [Schistosoma haematobium]|uniref:Uncharacterized protein n=1 Tax=Schistosoma haematobium TaxID=6185 RepID=A0A922IN15_SCHHA|nr:hypothetical protein MS3_00007384 [Schistosoma haematobium]KAH9582726.1 hypothetical protein MS3_00007384 [Schistosoma haematobium]
MSGLDIPADLFKKLVSILTTWLKTLDEFTKKEEEFVNTSRNLRNPSVDPKYWATTSELAYSVGNICECYVYISNLNIYISNLEKHKPTITPGTFEKVRVISECIF